MIYGQKPFTFQIIIIAGFVLFFYVFFALASQIYKDYKLELHIEQFEAEIEELASLARQKPEDVDYFSSPEYKDRYAKENLNLLNPGEKLIIIPQEEQIIVKGPLETSLYPPDISTLSALTNQEQWWEYFFGQTVSIDTQKRSPSLPSLEEPKEKSSSEDRG